MRKAYKALEQLEALLYRTENNIEFYLEQNKGYSLLNEIGVMRGLLYSWEAVTGYEKELNQKERSYIKLQQKLKEIDYENNINKTK